MEKIQQALSKMYKNYTLKKFYLIIYTNLSQIINLIDQNNNMEEYFNNNSIPANNIENIIKKISSFSTNEFLNFSGIFYNSVKFIKVIGKIYGLDNFDNFDNLNNKPNHFCLNMYKLLKLDINSSYNQIKMSFGTFFDNIKNSSDDQYFVNLIVLDLKLEKHVLVDKNHMKLLKFIGYFILLNPSTKKIYDKYYLINEIKIIQTNPPLISLESNNNENFLYLYNNICTKTNLTFDYNYLSVDFVKTIKHIFINQDNKINKFKKHINYAKTFEFEIDFKNDLDYKYDNFYSDDNDETDEFLDLYKLFGLDIDMSYEKIKENIYLQKENIILFNDIVKYVGYNILLNINTKKIYDNYYLDYYIKNWRKIQIEIKDAISNPNEILNKIDLVYANLFELNKINEEKINSEQITNLIDKYNNECESFVIKHEHQEKTKEELEEIYIKMNYDLLVNQGSNTNVRTDPDILKNAYNKCKNERDIFLQTIKNHVYNYNDEINKIIETYKNYNITATDLLDYNKHINNRSSNKNYQKYQSSTFDYLLFDDFKNSKKFINFSNFDIEDYNLWKINYKLKEKISGTDYENYLENRKIYENKINTMYKQNLAMSNLYWTINK